MTEMLGPHRLNVNTIRMAEKCLLTVLCRPLFQRCGPGPSGDRPRTNVMSDRIG